MSEPVSSLFRIVLLGPPASGKGTQGRRLAESLGLGYLSTGALLREEVEIGSELGHAAEPILVRGRYLPDDLMCRILAGWLDRQDGGWVLDGFPRSVPQAEFLENWLAGNETHLDAALALEVPYERLLARIRDRVECPDCRWSGQRSETSGGQVCPTCGAGVGPRADDTPENFAKRHQEFERLVVPVIDRYAGQGILIRCDATAPQDATAARLLTRISAVSRH